MKILVIADFLPYPLVGGASVRIYNILKRVAHNHEISLVAFLDKPSDIKGVAHLKQFCTHVETVNFERGGRRLAKLPGMLGYALAGKPPELKLRHSNELMRKIKDLASTIDFDIVQIEHAHMGLYLETLHPNKFQKSILMFHNFTLQQYGRVSHVEKRWDRKLRSKLNSIAMGYWEPRYAEKFDHCTTVSEEDRQLLLNANPHLQVEVIPNGVDIEKYQPLSSESISPSLLFLGSMGYPPNADAALYFCKEIFPLIRQDNKAAELWIVGRDPRSEVLELNNANVHVTGRVDDVIPYYRKSAICVVPLRAGGGTRLKILEAMALGRPVVSTTIGSEGLEVIDNENILIADTPTQFAEKTICLLRDRELYQRLSTNGRKLVETRYSWDPISNRLMELYAGMTTG